MGSTSADPAALIVALFKFNEISIEDGYIEADQVRGHAVPAGRPRPRGPGPAALPALPALLALLALPCAASFSLNRRGAR